MDMRFKSIPFSLIPIVLTFVGCGANEAIQATRIEIQLRCPTSVTISPGTQLSFHRERTIDFIPMAQTDSFMTNGFQVFSYAFDLRSRDQSKALVTYVSPAQPSPLDQVFLLPLV